MSSAGADGGLRIQLNVYDVLPAQTRNRPICKCDLENSRSLTSQNCSQNLSKANKVLADYIGAGGAFHAAVVVHYRSGAPLEWAFGGCDSGTGVFCTEPLALDGVFMRECVC